MANTGGVGGYRNGIQIYDLITAPIGSLIERDSRPPAQPRWLPGGHRLCHRAWVPDWKLHQWVAGISQGVSVDLPRQQTGRRSFGGVVASAAGARHIVVWLLPDRA